MQVTLYLRRSTVSHFTFHDHISVKRIKLFLVFLILFNQQVDARDDHSDRCLGPQSPLTLTFNYQHKSNSYDYYSNQLATRSYKLEQGVLTLSEKKCMRVYKFQFPREFQVSSSDRKKQRTESLKSHEHVIYNFVSETSFTKSITKELEGSLITTSVYNWYNYNDSYVTFWFFFYSDLNTFKINKYKLPNNKINIIQHCFDHASLLSQNHHDIENYYFHHKHNLHDIEPKLESTRLVVSQSN